MKSTRYLLYLLIAFTFITSCSNKPKTRDEQIKEFRATLTAEDTIQMLQLTDNAMKELKAKNVDKVLNSLYEYTDSTGEVKPITPQTLQRYKQMFRLFPVIDFYRDYYSFMLEGCNDVKYTIIWAPAEKTGTGEPAKSAIMFNPVKKDGQWLLCVKTPEDQSDPVKR